MRTYTYTHILFSDPIISLPIFSIYKNFTVYTMYMRTHNCIYVHLRLYKYIYMYNRQERNLSQTQFDGSVISLSFISQQRINDIAP